MLRKLRIKFVCINMLIVTIMMAAVFSVLFLSTSRTLEAESVEMMRTIAVDPMRPRRPDEFPAGLRLPYFAVRIGSNGEPADAGGSYFDLSDSAQIKDILSASQQIPQNAGILPDYHLRFYKTVTPVGDWIVFADTTSEQSSLKTLITNCIRIGCAAFVGFLIISIFLARWAVRPVDEAWKQQKQFVADASHELKTPLTVIMTNAEFLQDSDFTADDKERFTDGILDMCRQMRGLVERMLDLAHADDGKIAARFKKLDLSAIASDAVLPFEPVFYERGIALETDIESGVSVSGDEIGMRQLIEILLDNAQKYGLTGGRAVIRLQRGGHKKCVLTVSDTGDPIDKEDLKNLFKRFYRADKARGMNGSYGLGLSIAHSIVTAHGGRIRAESKDGVNSFIAELPLD